MNNLSAQIDSAFRSTLDIFTVQYPAIGVILALIGAWKIGRTFNSLFSVLIDTLVPRGPQLAPYKTSTANNWAVVTGPTAGIGEQFAHQLAAYGFNLALVSRNPAKLTSVAKDIESKYPNVKTSVFALDAASATPKNFADLKSFVEQLGNVSVLINNLGISHDMPTPFTEVSESALREIIQVNCVATLEITRAVLPSLEAYTSSSKSSRGLIMTMGSMAGLTPTPLLSVYSGSKMFLQGWSSALAQELKAKKIDVQLIISYLVTSQMSKVKRTSMMCPDPKAFVKSTLREIGLHGGAQERANTLTPYWSHALFHWFIESSVGVWSTLVASINYGMHLDIRKRALRKLAKQK